MDLQKILVDTDILIDFLRKKESARSLVDRASLSGDVYISTVTLAELMAGMKLSEETSTEELISGLTLLDVTENIARKAGELRRNYKNILLPDCLIAATALTEDCYLLTGNKKDYPFQGLLFF